MLSLQKTAYIIRRDKSPPSSKLLCAVAFLILSLLLTSCNCSATRRKNNSNAMSSDESTVNDIAIFLEILQAPTCYYASEEERETCRRLVEEELSEEEKDITAKTSYAYWYVVTKTKEMLEESVGTEMAMKEARRHLVGEHGNYEKTLDAMRKAIQFRKEWQIENLRTCFDSTADEDDLKLKSLVVDDLEKQQMVVRGHDRDFAAVGYKFCRQVPASETNEEAYILANLYSAERLVAATEFRTRGGQLGKEKIVMAFDFMGYESSNAPPLSALKKFVEILQRVYPERLKVRNSRHAYRLFFQWSSLLLTHPCSCLYFLFKHIKTLVVVEPPFLMRALYTAIFPFLAVDTRAKVQMASGEEKRNEIFRQLIDLDQAMPVILSGGKLDSSVNMDHFLLKVPFHLLYDDVDFPQSGSNEILIN
jgi:hypothetical protein